jgi:hypothetical protein
LTSSLLHRVRWASARVVERARHLRVDAERIGALAQELVRAEPAPGPDPAHHHVGDPDTTLAYVVTLDAVNFGSGWFPELRKRPGLSGYFSLAGALREHFAAHGAWSAAELQRLTGAECARIFGQDAGRPAVAELMALFARSLADLGRWLEARYGGRFAGPLEEAGGRAERLVELLAQMPLYRDVARHDGLEVPFYKRAQITAADLYLAFDGEGPGRFQDIDELTAFADNLVPHVLRWEGALVYAPELAARIDAGELLPAGCGEEVEIRAAAVHGVELCVAHLRGVGVRTSAREIDQRLWLRGQRPELKAHPRHRTRSPYY